jgi:F-type H+-transporting ATPase subunit b
MSSAPVILASGNSILSIDGSFLFIFLLIILLIFVLNQTLFRPVNHILEERERLGLGRSLEAQRMLKEAEQRTRNYESQIRAARATVYQQIEARRRELKASRLELLAAARKDAEAQLASARNEIASQADAARSSLERDAREMAENISAQLLRRPVSPGGIGAS